MGAKAELIPTSSTSWRWVGNYVTGEALHSECVSMLTRMGHNPRDCGSVVSIPPNSFHQIVSGWYRDYSRDDAQYYYLSAYACQNNDFVRYFNDIKKCVPITKLTTPVPANPKGNGNSCPFNSQDRQPTCGNPIAIGTGNKVQQERDYAALTTGLPLDLIRTYNGGVYSVELTRQGVFGSRWSHALDRKLTFTPNQTPVACFVRLYDQVQFCDYDNTTAASESALVSRPDGRIHRFNKADGKWVGEADVNESLAPDFDGNSLTPTAWRYTTASKDTEFFSATGKLLSVTSRTGVTQRLTYSTGVSNDTGASRWPDDAPTCSNVQPGPAIPAGLPVCVTDSFGRQLQFEYDEKSRVKKAIDLAGEVYQYEYDGASGGCFATSLGDPACTANNLTAVTFPGGKTRTYHYNEDSMINNGGSCYGASKSGNGFGHLLNALTGITDENGIRYASWGWDCIGRAISSQHAGGVDKMTIHNSASAADGSKTVAVTSHMGTAAAPVNVTRNYQFKISLGVAKNTAVDQPCEGCQGMQDRTYDARNNVLTSKEWTGATTVYTYEPTRNLETSRTEAFGTAHARTTSTEWHATQNLRKRVAEPLRITSNSYDDHGNLLSKSVQATTDANGSQGFAAPPSGAARTWTYTYDGMGQVLTVSGPGISETRTYDIQGNLATVTNAAGHVTSYGNYDANGRVGSITDPNGLTTTYAYGPRGWLESMNVDGEFTSYQYDAVGNLTTVTSPDGSTLTYSYDGARRLTDITDNYGNKVSYVLDLVGNRIDEQTKDATGTLTRRISRVFDTLNRVKQITGAQQ